MAINIQVSERGKQSVVHYSGPINEDAEIHLQNLGGRIDKNRDCVFNFKKVEFINSCGVRAWINFIRDFEKGRRIFFEECTSEVVMQINMIPSFRGGGIVQSVFGSYHCDDCRLRKKVLFERGKNWPSGTAKTLPKVMCDKCGDEVEMEELEDEFFAFDQVA